MARLQGLVGIVVLLAVAGALSERPKAINWRTVVAGLAAQFLVALAMLRVPPARWCFQQIGRVVQAIADATGQGTAFVFGYLGGGPAPFQATAPENLYVLALQGLPLVLVFSALSAVLFHWRILPAIIGSLSWVLRKSLGLGGCEALCGAANIFTGMIEAPLFVRPYLAAMSRSELFALMTTGMATIGGTVMGLYATFLKNAVPDAFGHILVASVISAPAAFVVCKLMIPQDSEPAEGRLEYHDPADSTIDALCRGTTQGIGLLINIIFTLVVFVALVALINRALALMVLGDQPLTLQRMLGWVMAPVAWLLGVPWAEAGQCGALLGIKTVLNELLAYLEMARIVAEHPEALSERSRLIMTYALCGFANLGSLGIMIGGLSSLCPEKRSEVVQLGLWSILSGTLATCMTGAVVGVLYT